MAMQSFTSVEGFPDFIRDILYNILTDNSSENIVVSTSSIKCVMGLIYCASDGDTAVELKSVLKIEDDLTDDDIAEIAKQFLNKANSKTTKLTSVTQIYVDKRFKIKESFIELADSHFDCDVTQVDFTDVTETLFVINKWVKENTAKTVENAYGSLSPITTAICLNITYFEARWLEKFIKLHKKRVFTTSEGSKVWVNMMFLEGTFKYAKIDSLNAHVIQLPLANTKISMLIILPKKTIPLMDMEKQVRQLDFNMILSKLHEKDRVRVNIPIFRIYFNTTLRTTLQDMLIRLVFTKKSDMSNMIEDEEPLIINDVNHIAILEINTSGIVVKSTLAELQQQNKTEPEDDDERETEIAKVSQSHRKFVDFTADYPFLFAILEEDHVYFAGHVVTFKTSKTDLHRMLLTN